MGRILAIDYGTVRIGLAISDPTGIISLPLPAIPAAGAPKQLAALCRDRQVERVIIGLPRQFNGQEGPSAAAARALGDQLAKHLPVPLEYLDERLTTRAAERVLLEADVSRRKRREKVDSMAAAILLQNYLDARGQGPAAGAGPGAEAPPAGTPGAGDVP